MPANDPILLNQILDQRNAELAPTLDKSQYFELFTAEQLLKDYSLSYDELNSGLVGGGNDGGIDGIWLFANGELIQEDTEITNLKKNVELELVILQSKRSAGFTEEPINKLIAVTENLLNFGNKTSDFADRYNTDLRSAVDLFRDTYEKLAGRFPTLKITYYYATLGSQIHANTHAKAADLKAKIPALFSDADTSFEFIGAADLIELGRQQPKISFTLNLAESMSASGAVAYVCLVRLGEWYDFITDEKDGIRGDLFEANVRDFQGNTEVNKEIQSSLQHVAAEDFWWLNNGITVLASQATQSAKALTVEDPQIVNGLQTSRQIFEHYSQNKNDNDDRLVLVRVIVTDADESRDRIIKATNSQTYIPPASLKATDKIQRDIEEYLKPYNIYYDRRKNYYKNEGKPVSDIVSISKMAQAVMSIAIARPDTARARPSSLIKSDTDYPKLFNENHPIEAYLSCINMLRAIEDALRGLADMPQKDKNNIKFYAALELGRAITSEVIPSLTSLRDVATNPIDKVAVSSAISKVRKEYEILGGTDQVAKGPDLKIRLDTFHSFENLNQDS